MTRRSSAAGQRIPIYKKADLYSITGTGVPQSCFESSNIAPVNAGPRMSAVATVQYLNEQGKASAIAQVSNKVPGVGDWLQAGVKQYAKDHDVKVVKSILHDPASIDANSIVLDVKNAKPSAVILQDPGPLSAAILKAGATQGLEKKFVWSCLTSCYDASFPSRSGRQWEGFIANSELQLVDAKTPDNLLWRTVLQKYGSAKDPRDTFGQSGFLAAKILTDTLLKLDPDEHHARDRLQGDRRDQGLQVRHPVLALVLRRGRTSTTPTTRRAWRSSRTASTPSSKTASRSRTRRWRRSSRRRRARAWPADGGSDAQAVHRRRAWPSARSTRCQASGCSCCTAPPGC